MRSAILSFLICALSVAGLGCARAPLGEPDMAEADGVMLAAPATYAGTLPCASCPGIEWTLTLLEDGSFRLRRVYLEAEAGQDRAHVDLGRWTTDGGTEPLVLRGSAEGPIYLVVVDGQALRLLDRAGKPIESQLDYGLRKSATVDRISDVFPMRGDFVYFADAARFAERRTGESLPVAQEADYLALERAYLEARTAAGAPLVASFDGRFALRPPMEGDGLQEVVIVEAFKEVQPGGGTEGAVAPAPLEGTYWELTDLPDEPGFAVDPGRRAHLFLDGESGRVRGSSGCNRFTGGYTLNGSALSFGPLAGTRMACAPSTMELEQRFYKALGAVVGYSIDGERLTLTGPGGPVARFVRYLE